MTTPPSTVIQGVLITPRVAAKLETLIDLRAIRVKNRGEDSELDAALLGIRYEALKWLTYASGSQPRKSAEVATPSFYTPSQVAAQLGITEHAVRLAIREHRLPATKHNGRWHITPADYQLFKKDR